MWRRPVVTILMLVIAVILTLPLRAQHKPFTQEQVTNMVRAGLGDDSGAKLIEQRGIDFAPSEDFIQTLKRVAGASDLVTVNFSFDAEPTVNSQAELALATCGSHNLRRRSNCNLCACSFPLCKLKSSVAQESGKLLLCRHFCGFVVTDFFFYSLEGREPPHIHVAHASRYAKFWLVPVVLADNRGFRGHELTEIRQLVAEKQKFFLEKWYEYFGRES